MKSLKSLTRFVFTTVTLGMAWCRPAGAFADTVNTAVGAGADIEMREQSNLSANTVAMNTRTSSNGDRNEIIGLRFDLSGYTLAYLTNVSLRLTSFRSDTGTRVVDLYGVAQGTVGGTGSFTTENWDETALTAFGDLPGLLVTDTDYLTQSINVGSVTYLGRITVVGAVEGAVQIFSDPALTAFIESYAGSSRVTFLLAAGSASTGQFRIASKEATELATTNLITGPAGTFAPALDFTVANPCTNCPPAISAQPVGQTVLAGGTAVFQVRASGTAPLAYQWWKDGTNIVAATNDTYTIVNVQTNDAGSYSVVVSNAYGSVTSSNALLAVASLGGSGDEFQIISLTTNGSAVIDHDALTGDDRGGIAASATQVFYSGDFSTARFRIADLSGGTGLGVIRDAMVSDLRSETVYSLGNGSTPLGYGGGTVTTLLEMDGATGALTGRGINLSSPIPMSSGAGIFASYGRVVLHNGGRVYNIELPSGTVIDLGAMTMPTHTFTESWAFWGVAEYFGGSLYLAYVRDSQTIVRTRLPDGLTTTLASFSSLSDMASITMSVPLSRWYFHYEGSSQFGGSSETLGYATALFNVVSTNPPVIAVQPQNQTVIVGGTAVFTVLAYGGSPLSYQWRRDGTNILEATNGTYTIIDVQSNYVGSYSVVVSNAYGSATSSNALLTVVSLGGSGDEFQIVSLTTNGSAVIDHNALTGDDRGGIAASATQIFYSGDNATARFHIADLSGGTGLGVIRDALVSDLRSETVYSLGNGSTPLGNGGGIVTTLLEMDGATGDFTGRSINLSSPIPTSSGSGIFAGYGRVVLHNGSRVYNIELPSGTVIDLGAITIPTHTFTESWAFWGVAEYFGGSLYLAYVRDSQTIVRTRLPDGLTTTLASFSNLSDMASITMSIPLSRWYFHHEGSSQFGGSSETLGYATALFNVVSTNPPAIAVQPQNQTAIVGGTATFTVLAYGGLPLSYQWRRDGAPISGATNSTHTLVNAQGEHVGSYDVLITNPYGSVTSSNAVLILHPPGCGADATIVNALDTGWYDSTGSHGSDNANYLVGNSGPYYRDWFAFDVPPLSGTLVAAELRVSTYGVSTADGSETYELHAVSTPVATLRVGGSGLVSIYNDLGDGTVYGSRAFTSADSYQTTVIPLNPTCLAALTAASGGTFAFGGLITTLDGITNNEEYVFGFSQGNFGDVQLTLTISSCGGPCPPQILIQPTNQIAEIGDTVTLRVVAIACDPPSYQWLKDGTNITDATNGIFVITDVQTADSGTYSVIATSSGASIISSNAVLRVNRPPVADASATSLMIISSNGTNATVILDGSRSSDPDDDPLQFDWYESGSPLASGALAVSVVSVGSHAIQLVVSDGAAAATNAIIVRVITTSQAAAGLAAVVNTTVARPQPFLATLNAATASIDRGNSIPAINQLLAFQNQVRAQLSSRDPARAAALIQAAQEIIDALSGDNTNPSGRPHGNIASFTRALNGRVQMQLALEPGQNYLIEASTNLVDWKTIGVVHGKADGSGRFEDVQAASFPQRFYRVRSP